MDYEQLAEELLNVMTALIRVKAHKEIEESLHGELFALGYIARKGGVVNPGEISSSLNISKGRTTVTITSLEKKGFITRQIDPDNRSRIIVRITKEGTKVVDKNRKCVIDNLKRRLEFLGEQDAAEFVRILLRLAEYTPFIEDKE